MGRRRPTDEAAQSNFSPHKERERDEEWRRRKKRGKKKRERFRKLLEHGEQRSLYAQAIFTTKPPGRAELTREVTSQLSTFYRLPAKRLYVRISPGKWLVKNVRSRCLTFSSENEIDKQDNSTRAPVAPDR